jgi:hypothetical protein
MNSFLGSESSELLFWGFDVGLLARQLEETADRMTLVRVAQAA